jgi:hypothetical protein
MSEWVRYCAINETAVQLSLGKQRQTFVSPSIECQEENQDACHGDTSYFPMTNPMEESSHEMLIGARCSGNARSLMTPVGSLLCSKHPATGPQPEATETSYLRSILISSSYLCLGLTSYLQVFRLKVCMHFSHPPRLLYAPPSTCFMMSLG